MADFSFLRHKLDDLQLYLLKKTSVLSIWGTIGALGIITDSFDGDRCLKYYTDTLARSSWL